MNEKQKCPKCNRFVTVKDGKLPTHRTKKGNGNKNPKTRALNGFPMGKIPVIPLLRRNKRTYN